MNKIGKSRSKLENVSSTPAAKSFCLRKRQIPMIAELNHA